MQPELPPSYYLDNVLTLFEHVSRVYADILETAQLEFLQHFAELNPDAQKLCIRLLNRNSDWFRATRLNYPEIASIEASLAELAQTGFVELDGNIDYPDLLSIFTKAELLAAVDDDAGLDKLRRAQLEAALLALDDMNYFTRLASGDTLIRVLRRDDYQICQMLFFGNLNQSMTDFVLRDLGLHQFESYSIDQTHRPYRSTLEIQQHWQLYQLEARFGLGKDCDPALLHEINDLIPGDIATEAPAHRRCERLRFEIARQFERLGDPDTALGLYRQCPQPPSRERIARIHDKLEKYRQAFEDCLDILATPLDETEVQFASNFAARLARRHGFDCPQSVELQRITHQPEIVDLELELHDSVETVVAEHYATLDPTARCYFLENSLFNGVLGLLIWDAVFAPLPGAFFNPFQYRPSDFHAPDFCERRIDLLAQTWNSIKTNEDIWHVVERRWHRKQGLMNPLVNWQNLDLEIIRIALERIEFTHWCVIFKRILRDLSANRAGFPDLVHFPADGGYCLIEVKAPGDSLQRNQQRWMQYFHEHGIPHRLARVAWRTS